MAKLEIRVNHTPSNRFYTTHRCEHCGKTVYKDYKFCPECGKDITEVKDGGEEEVLGGSR